MSQASGLAGAVNGGSDNAVGTQGDGDGSEREETGDGDAESDGAAAEGTRPSDEGSESPDEAWHLSAETFLDELALESEGEHEGASDSEEVAVAWTEERGLVEVAADVIEAYAEVPTASLATSGYLDLAGNVWAALVQDARGWVDIVSVTSSSDDSSTTVRIVRLLAGEAPSP